MTHSFDKPTSGLDPGLQTANITSQRYLRLVTKNIASWIFALISEPIAIALTAWILRNETPLR